MAIRDLMPFGRTAVPVSRGSGRESDFYSEMNRLVEDFFGTASLPGLFNQAVTKAVFDFAPAVDVKETEDSFKIVADVPGTDGKDINVTVADGYVTIKGEKKVETKEEKAGYYRQERSYGSFQRVIALPESANLEKAEASVKDGVLRIEVPKKSESRQKQRTIEIKRSE